MKTAKAIRLALGSLPQGVDETYERILLKVPQNAILMRRALQLIIYAVRPVTLEEVAEAVVTEVGQDSLDIESRLHKPELLLAICGSLISFNNDTIGLAHYSVQEYLISERIQHGPARELAMTETKAAFELSAICLTYLGFNDFNVGPISAVSIKFRQQRFPFLTYAATNWFVHAKVQSVEPRIIALATKIFNNDANKNFYSWRQVRWTTIPEFIHRGFPYWETPLAYMIRLKLPELTRHILQTGASVPCAQLVRQTIIENYTDMLEVLLQHGADPNTESDGPTPVYCAARVGMVRQSKLLLQYGNLGLLVLATQGPHRGTMQVLLQHGADCNEVDFMGNTALYYAVRYRDPMKVSLLLEHGADPSPTPGFRTPSRALTEIWLDSIVEILQQSSVSITTSDEWSIHISDDDTIRRLDRIVHMLSPPSPVGDAPLLLLADDPFGKIVEMLLW